MAGTSIVITAEIHERFQQALETIGREANAKLVFLIDKAGQQLACSGEMDGVDPTALASLTAGNVAATEGVAGLVGEDEFKSMFHEGRTNSLVVSVVSDKVILLVVFDERSSLGLVRLRVDQHRSLLEECVQALLQPGMNGDHASDPDAGVFADITEADIDALFG
jgi:predicted regulator of Ras-like GTPase activity (Roadblock/LC7/MglB family)